jgi:uncharacterized damage-inducible protein DinB
LNVDLARAFLDQSRAFLRGDYLPKIEGALERMSEDDLWWRPNAASNSAGNLVLHLAGNVRQWIVSGLGGAPDVRARAAEFAATGGVAREGALAHLRAAVDDASTVLARLAAADLAAHYTIQGNTVTGLYAVYHVVEHFAMHTGQIVWLAKARAGEDLGFYETFADGRARLRWTPTPEGPAPRG